MISSVTVVDRSTKIHVESRTIQLIELLRHARVNQKQELLSWTLIVILAIIKKIFVKQQTRTMPKSTYFDVACVVLFLLLNWKPTTTGGLCSPCPGSWTVFGRFCYIFVDQPLTYDDAEAHCYSLSRTFRKSHLISIANEDENDFVAGYAESAGGTVGIC